MKTKINRNEYLDMVTASLPVIVDEETKQSFRLSSANVRTIYDMFVKCTKDVVFSGKDLSLTGFGSFTLKTHKGHPVQFENPEEEKDSRGKVGDYVVLKFTASDVLMNDIRAAYKEGRLDISGK